MLNKVWHQNNRMPAKATLEQRIQWHQEHQKHCACREVPKSNAHGLTTGSKSVIADFHNYTNAACYFVLFDFFLLFSISACIIAVMRSQVGWSCCGSRMQLRKTSRMSSGKGCPPNW